MIILGIILLIAGFLLKISILWQHRNQSSVWCWRFWVRRDALSVAAATTSDMGSILSRGQSEAAGRNRRCGPPLRCGQVSSPVGVERVDADALSSLTCADWLPQDRGFEVGVWPLV